MMTLDNIIHEEVLKWKRFGLFKLGMIRSFADACYNAYASLIANDGNGSLRDHTFFAIVVDDVHQADRVAVQFNYRIDVNMGVALVSLTCTIADVLKPYFVSCVSLLPSYSSIVASFSLPETIGHQQNDAV